jgi:hypothetical protein
LRIGHYPVRGQRSKVRGQKIAAIDWKEKVAAISGNSTSPLKSGTAKGNVPHEPGPHRTSLETHPDGG